MPEAGVFTINVQTLFKRIRAFRRAEMVFSAVLLESCVGEGAGSLAVASIFFSRVGTFGCRFRCLLGAFGDPRAALEVAWGSFGGPFFFEGWYLRVSF